MSNNKMLIDATHPEETRVVVLRNGRVEEFDYESAARKLLRGNIYLAKVTRVEPSLQAAFVDYGGNRHGFLAFNEIHPDYYQIPMADRQALLEEEAAAEAAEEAAVDAHAERLARRRNRRHEGRRGSEGGEGRSGGGNRNGEGGGHEHGAESAHDHDQEHDHDHDHESDHEEHDDHDHRTLAEASAPDEVIVEEIGGPDGEPETVGGFEPEPDADADGDDRTASAGDDASEDAQETSSDQSSDLPDAPHEVGLVESEGVQEVAPAASEVETVEQTGSEDALEEVPYRPRRRARSYKIQEVIKRRQIILVQVVKEERGNKGAALTTYLSLAGRYTVLMPNTARGGGISRKITNPQDRKRLKAIANELEVPEGMGLIIRTAGAARTKQEIKRDFEYLLRLWESVRDLTLQSTAPSLVYEEGNLIKRSIRDLYNKDVEEIVVAGDHAHAEARDFMRMLMPSHAKNVLLHAEAEPLFTRYRIETQLNAMFSPFVTLRSGGYLVINQTEALVAIDVNSGKSTREFSIEETALNTNLEASDEIARQLKLRDLAGLIVIDFIDMEEKRNNRAVERRLKDALRFDRARIQLGRISHFGLMEMSRQRLRTGVLEGSTSQCPHCQGTGIIRSTESVALAVLRGLEDALMAGARTSLIATTTAQVALYILNNKRNFINDMEGRNGVSITVQASDKLQGANFTIERGHARAEPVRRPDRTAVNMDWGFEGETPEEAEEVVEEPENESEGAGEPVQRSRDRDRERDRDAPRGEDDGRGGEDGGRRRRRRRRRGRRGDRPGFEGQRNEGYRAGEENGGSGDTADGVSFAGDMDAGDDNGPGGDGDDIEIPGTGDQPDTAGGRFSGQGASEERGERDEERGGRRRRRGRRGGRRGRDGRDGERTWERPHALEGGEIVDDFEGTQNLDGVVTDAAEAGAGQPAAPAPHRDRAARDGGRQGGRHRQPEAAPAGGVEPDSGLPKEPADEAATGATGRKSKPEFEPVAAPASQPEPSAAAEPPKARSRRSSTSSSEPKIERVVVKPDAAAPEVVPEAAEAQPGPTRKGWWQRTLGG